MGTTMEHCWFFFFFSIKKKKSSDCGHGSSIGKNPTLPSCLWEGSGSLRNNKCKFMNKIFSIGLVWQGMQSQHLRS